jgi:hypothetical protein
LGKERRVRVKKKRRHRDESEEKVQMNDSFSLVFSNSPPFRFIFNDIVQGSHFPINNILSVLSQNGKEPSFSGSGSSTPSLPCHAIGGGRSPRSPTTWTRTASALLVIFILLWK